MPLRVPDKYKRVLHSKLTDDERTAIVKKYRLQRVLSSVLVVGLTIGSSAYVAKDFVDSRFAPVKATDAVNRQDEMQEQEDVIYFSGESIRVPGKSGPVAEQTKKVVSSDNVLLVGMDSRQGANGEIGAGSASQVTGVRTDSIMFLHIPKSGGQPSVVSFPRDLSVDRQDCASWTGSGYEETSTVGEREDVKINSLYGAGGPRCLVRTVQEITGMKVNRFVSVDFAGFQGIVDSLGGIDITVDRPMVDGELGVIVDKPGKVHLDGQRALDFVRARKIEGDLRGDYDRIERQQQFGMAVLQKMSSGSTLRNPSRMNSVTSAVYDAVSGENIDTNFILSVLQRAGEFQSAGVRSQTIPTSGTNDNGNEVMDDVAAEELMRSIAVESD